MNFTLADEQSQILALAGSSAKSAVRAGLPSRLRLSPNRISATVLVKDSERHIGSVLHALLWCDEVVVLDSGSTDDTLKIAARFPNVVIERFAGPFPGFGTLHRMAATHAANDWILSIDSDEIVTSELAREISALELDPQAVYAMPFHNYFNDRKITTCGWHPDRHERLFNRQTTNFSASLVHEKVGTENLRVQLLQGPVRHYSYGSLEDFLGKMQAYTTLFADQNAGRRTGGPLKACARGTWSFCRSYFMERGILQGYEGFVISAYQAQTVFWKYLKLGEANRKEALGA